MKLNTKTKPYWILFVLAGLMASFAHAQNDMRPVKILYHKAPKDAPQNAYIYVGEELVAEELVANPNLTKANFSKTFEIPRGDKLLKFLPNELEEGTEPAKKAPSVNIPAAWQKILLLVYLDEENEVMPIKGNQEVSILPKKFKVIDFPASRPGSYPVVLKKIVKGDNKPKDFIKTMWQQARTTRQVLFIIPREAPYHATYFNAPVRSF